MMRATDARSRVEHVAMTWPLGNCLTMIYNETDHQHNEHNMAVAIHMISENYGISKILTQATIHNPCHQTFLFSHKAAGEYSQIVVKCPQELCGIVSCWEDQNGHRFAAGGHRCHVGRIRTTTDVKCRDGTIGALVSFHLLKV